MKLQNEIYRNILAWMFKDWGELNVNDRRKRQQRFDKLIKLSKTAHFSKENIGKLQVVRISPPHFDKKVVYFHGGGYVLGLTKNHLNLCSAIANQNNAQVILVEYRLAPENPFPAALEDAVIAYTFIVDENQKSNNVFVGGDSAGGGLALSLLNELKKDNFPLPAGAFCFSPWTDLTLSGTSIREKASCDPILSQSVLAIDAKNYAGAVCTTDPRISPLFASLYGLPPILIQVGENEILLDDAKSFAKKAKKASLLVELEIWPEMYHVFQLLPFLPQAEDALSHVAKFIKRITMND